MYPTRQKDTIQLSRRPEMNQTELAGIVCARICHDLVGPVGAMVNGADLIGELGLANAGEEMVLVAQSARRAAAMLKFHRLAFGPVGDSAATLARGQMCERVSEVLAGPRVQFTCSALEGPAIGLPEARLLCLMLLAGRAMLGLSGSLKMVLPTSGTLPAAVIAQGDKTGATDDQRRWLAGEPGAAPDSRRVEFALIGPAAAAAGARIELVEGAGELALRAVLV
jgi:histidine phosphotransferase ChpT